MCIILLDTMNFKNFLKVCFKHIMKQVYRNRIFLLITKSKFLLYTTKDLLEFLHL